jgi:REP element-mobilizing transposase RayT
MDKYRKKSSRNEKWNYSSPSIYFVTFCTYRHSKRFGEIIDNKMNLNDIGCIVDEEIVNTFKIRGNLRLHKYVIMPNHVHILFEILSIVETPRRGVSININNVSIMQWQNFHKPYLASSKWKCDSISSTICQIKSIATKRIRKIPTEFGWQPRFYDEIIKDRQHYWKVKKYIENNIVNWETDEYA